MVTIFSIMVTWALENAIETADSMKSRGYGLKGRTAFSIYRFDKRDRQAMVWLLFCGCVVSYGLCSGSLKWQYFPMIKGADVSAAAVCAQVVYLMLCGTPVFLNRREDRKWNCLRSEI